MENTTIITVVDINSWIEGLRGLAADWAKKNLYPVVADDLKMIESTE